MQNGVRSGTMIKRGVCGVIYQVRNTAEIIRQVSTLALLHTQWGKTAIDERIGQSTKSTDNRRLKCIRPGLGIQWSPFRFTALIVHRSAFSGDNGNLHKRDEVSRGRPTFRLFLREYNECESNYFSSR